MARLRVRMEMNQGGMGVPLHKLVGVAGETHRFFNMLCEDIRIDTSKGEWLALDFDETSLSFTVEYVGPLNPAQVREFYEAFSGSTPLRKATIGQFARIADSIDEDEMIGFGFFHGDDDTEPHEWRSLSRRDALRIGEEMRTLAEAMEQNRPESLMPQSSGLEQAASYFRERRDHGPDRVAVETFLRAVEARLLQRITRLESDVSGHSAAIQNLKDNSAGVEQSMKHLLAVVEDFCDRASQQFSRLPAAAPAVSEGRAQLSASAAAEAEEKAALPGGPEGGAAAEAGEFSPAVEPVYAKPAPEPAYFSASAAAGFSGEAPEPGFSAAPGAGFSAAPAESGLSPAAAEAGPSPEAAQPDYPTTGSGRGFFPVADGSSATAHGLSTDADEVESAPAAAHTAAEPADVPATAAHTPETAASESAEASVPSRIPLADARGSEGVVESSSEPLPDLGPGPSASRGWMWGVAAAAAVIVAGVLYGVGAFESQPRAVPPEGGSPQTAPVAVKPAPAAPAPVEAAAPPPASASPAGVSVRLLAAENCWVTVSVGEKQRFTGVLEPGQTKTFEANEAIRVRTGNAGGLSIEWNGKPVGPLGPHGQIRLVELSPSSYRLVTPPVAKPLAPAAGL